MTFTVGRLSIGGDSSVRCTPHTGNRVRVSGEMVGTTLLHAKAMRQQALGYFDNFDEQIVPVTNSDDTSIDGYYRVLGVAVAEVAASHTAFWFEYAFDLERVPGYAQPLLESRTLGALRTNSAGITAANSQPYHGFPSASTVYDYDRITAVALASRTADTGGVFANISSGTGSGIYYDATPQWMCPPADFYDGAALIEVGSTLYPVVGSQVQLLPTNWRMGNGLVRVIAENLTSPTTELSLSVSVYDGSAWSTAKKWIVSDAPAIGSPTPWANAVAVTILRNSPEECAVRLTCGRQGGKLGLVDLKVRRGSRLIECRASKVDSVLKLRVALDVTSEAGTTVTGGLRATSNDAGGDRYVISSPDAVTYDTTTGGFTTNSATTAANFAVGCEINGSGASSPEAAQDLVYQYHAAVTERLLVVGR